MNDEVQGLPTPSSARRRLLKGTFAVPTVMTLRSGSALAASSMLNSFSKQPTGAATAATPDNILRVKRYKTKVSGSELTVFSGDEIVAYQNNVLYQSGFLTSRFVALKWYRVDTGSETGVGGGSNAPTASGNYMDLVALRMISNNDPATPKFTIVGVADNPSESGLGQVMTTSCWTSVF